MQNPLLFNLVLAIVFSLGNSSWAVGWQAAAAKIDIMPKQFMNISGYASRDKLAESKLKAALFGYACHCTVLSFRQWLGDYAGFAHMELDKRHPGCVALFWAGCRCDQNPLPRR